MELCQTYPQSRAASEIRDSCIGLERKLLALVYGFLTTLTSAPEGCPSPVPDRRSVGIPIFLMSRTDSVEENQR